MSRIELLRVKIFMMMSMENSSLGKTSHFNLGRDAAYDINSNAFRFFDWVLHIFEGPFFKGGDEILLLSKALEFGGIFKKIH